MSFRFNENYFIDSMPNILTNDKLRPPQYEAYQAIKKYYEKEEYPNRNALVVLPTGCGKTGVMAIAPVDICKKRTLIITPGNTIRDTVLDSLDPSNANNFWYEYDVFFPGITLPNVIEYESDTTDEVLSVANIVILNIQKLQERLSSSLLNRVDSDFFDFIIIDEAHHSTANTWVNCINYFKDAKILKLTGTPFRTDGEKINGELIYEYPLSRAMYHGYIKSLQNIVYTPDEVKLTIDNDDSKLYTIDEIFNMGLRDQDWVTRSVAFSEECSLKIVDASIEELNKKTSNSNIPHKIIAIACSIKHAKQIAKLYESRNIKTAVIYSDLPIEEKNAIFKDIENHRVQAVINVAMLGEGYDHKYTYSHLGYNLKITDMQASVGYSQIKKVNGFIEKRKENFIKIKDKLKRFEKYFILPEAQENSEPSWFGFLISVREDAPFNRNDIVKYLNDKKIGTRLLFAGNIIKQPYMKDRNYRVIGDMKNSDFIMNNTFWIGVYPAINDKMIEYIEKCFEIFIDNNYK